MADAPKGENLLNFSWCDSRWVPVLNSNNVLDYFSERSNPFYSRDCNNEFIKMQQNARMDQLSHMQGVEYVLLHAQDPILYIVRKQQRFSPTHFNPLACYHIIAGEVFQTPDLGAVINSRLASAINHLSSSFTEMQSFSNYHPSRGYWWNSPKSPQDINAAQKVKDKKKSRKEEVASMFQRRRVDLLLSDLATKFPFKPQSNQASTTVPTSQPLALTAPSSQAAESAKTDEGKSIKSEMKSEVRTDPNVDVKQEPSTTQPMSQRNGKPPPEKRQKLG